VVVASLVVVVVAGAWVVVVVASLVVVVVAGALVVVVVAGAWVVVVVARLVVVVVAGARVVVVVAGLVVVVVGGALVVVVVAGLVVAVVAWLVVVVSALVVVVVPWRRPCKWFRNVAPEVLSTVNDLALVAAVLPTTESTVAPEVLLAAKEFPSAARVTAMRTPPAKVRRRRIGEALWKYSRTPSGWRFLRSAAAVAFDVS
jgi:hypothetical protein